MTRIIRLAILAAPLLSLPALAADGSCRNAAVSIDEAIRIARDAGMAQIKEVECDRERWEVEGWHTNGREFEVKISAQDGRVLKTEYD